MLIGEFGPAQGMIFSAGVLVFLGWVLWTAPAESWREALATFGLVAAGALVGGAVGGSGIAILQGQILALSSLGAIAGGALALVLVLSVWRDQARQLADSIVPGGIAGLAVARVSCLFEGCDFGRIGDSPMALVYGRETRAWAYHVTEYGLSPSSPISLAVHPFAAYLAIWGLISAIAGEVLRRRGRPAGVGASASAICFLVGGGIIELLREPATVPNLIEGLSVYPSFYWMGAAIVFAIYRHFVDDSRI